MVLTFKEQELQHMFKTDTLDKCLSMTHNMSVGNLHLFDARGRMVRYESILMILEEFYVFRLDVYKKRKAYYLEKLKNDLDLCLYKVRFIKEYLAGTLLIAKQTVARVIEQLETKKYPRLARDHRALDADKSYRYLTDMSILTLTDDKIKELEADREECQMLYDDYASKTVEQLWLGELDVFLDAYKKWQIEWEKENDITNLKAGEKQDKVQSKARGKAKKADDDETPVAMTSKASKASKTSKTNKAGKTNKASKKASAEKVTKVTKASKATSKSTKKADDEKPSKATKKPTTKSAKKATKKTTKADE
jgi:DNA topoisomerase-2